MSELVSTTPAFGVFERVALSERIAARISRLSTASRKRIVDLPGVRTPAIEDHQAIVEALTQRDPEAAANRMPEHLKDILNNLRQAAAHGNSSLIAKGE